MRLVMHDMEDIGLGGVSCAWLKVRRWSVEYKMEGGLALSSLFYASTAESRQNTMVVTINLSFFGLLFL